MNSAVGQELLGVDGVRCRGGRIASNETYTVVEVSDETLTLEAPDASQRVVTLKAARQCTKRPYARTGHSTQGLSLGTKLFIHDWRSMMATHRWLRTAISRCSTLDIILVEGSQGVRNDRIRAEARIALHRADDTAKGFVRADTYRRPGPATRSAASAIPAPSVPSPWIRTGRSTGGPTTCRT